MSTTLPLLLEVGCEEIPARFLADAEKQFGERLLTALEEARLLAPTPSRQDGPRLRTYSTPRRLIAHVPVLLANQPDLVEEVLGPPVKVAFDRDGTPTKAAESFAAKNGATLGELIRVSAPKGEYIALRKTIPGRASLKVLPEILPEVITGVNFPKSMYWVAKLAPRWVRPIRWIIALLGEGPDAQVVPFELLGVRPGNSTYGRRFAGDAAIRVSGFRDYTDKLRAAYVEVDPERRREAVKLGVQGLLLHQVLRSCSGYAKNMGWIYSEGERERRLVELQALPEGLRPVPDPELENWIVNSSEWPCPILGDFEERFLKLPREILITVMRDHQHYFAVEDEHGSLQPKFISVLNVKNDPRGIIRRGHERVLAARFTDAEFFWHADQKTTLEERQNLLPRVTYQAKLGTYEQKVFRMMAVADRLFNQLGIAETAEGRLVQRAIRLCKCDLTTQMVQEFPELQGIVGGLYARAQGQPAEVADAIYDHYLPLNIEDRCPRSRIGAVVSLADKLDSVVAGFSVGLEPTGSSDPFGLRRAGNGIVKVSVEMLPSLDLHELAHRVCTESGAQEPEKLWGKVASFLRERVEYHLSAAGGLRYDTVRAVIESRFGWAIPSRALRRGKALENIRDTEDFVALAQAAKRTRNILHKSAKLDDFAGLTEVDPHLLTAGPEQGLYEVCQAMRERLEGFERSGEYEAGFRALAAVRPLVDRFFDKVLVMDDNEKIRANRLRLLSELSTLVFLRFADLSQIESAP